MSQTSTQHSKSVSDFFHGYATGFDAIYGNKHSGLTAWVNDNLRKSMRLRFEKTIEGCQPAEGRSVLDIGTGPGHYAVLLAKQGASPVVGMDFAEGMLDVAKKHAQEQGVADKCTWDFGDFLTYEPGRTFDYLILMGFMDYIQDPVACIRKAISLTDRKAFFSFPSRHGLLALQRKIRYKFKCPLYLYTRDRLEGVLKKAVEGTDAKFTIEPIQRDFFVTISKPGA